MPIGVPRLPRVDPQLQTGSTTEGEDCAVCVMIGGIRWATRGQLVPTVAEVRQAIGVLAGGVGITDCLDGYHHFGINADKLTTFDPEVIDALDNRAFVHAAVDYTYINRYLKRLSGDPHFTADNPDRNGKPAHHAIGVFGVERVIDQGTTGPHWSEDLDPLHDARRAGIPKQPTMIKRAELKAAMLATGFVGAIAVTR